MSRTPTPLRVRLLAKVHIGPAGCWNFTGRLSREGYGRLWSGPGGKADYAHRLAYEDFVGPIPPGLELDHLCRNTACVNPAHLEAVQPRVNKLRSEAPAAINAKKTACTNGHPFDEANTHRLADGKRRCRTCSAATSRRYYAKKRAAA